MQKSISAALAATLAVAQQDAFLLRHLDVGNTQPNSPNVGLDEAACTVLNDATDSVYYEFAWNTEGCFCSHQWKSTAPYYSFYTTCSSGEVLNPHHEPGQFSDRCITQQQFDDCEDFHACVVEPEPLSCQALFGDADNEPTGYASAYLSTDTDATMYSSSGFESGFLTFTEMCGGTCAGNPCDGTCVEGNFWGMRDEGSTDPSEFGLYVQEYDVDGTSAFGCAQTGNGWNPAEVAHGTPDEAIFPAGVLGNLVISAQMDPAPPLGSDSQCLAQPFSYCAAPGLLKQDDLTRRSVALRAFKDEGSSGAGVGPSAPIVACGSLTVGIINPLLNALPADATIDGTGDVAGSAPCSAFV